MAPVLTPPKRHPLALDVSLLGRGPGSLSDDPTSWVHAVHVPGAGPRNLLREALVSAKATWTLARDTTRTEKVFDVMGNFPVHDVVVAGNARAKLLADPRFHALFAERSMPDLRTRTVLSFLDTLPEGSVGHGYATYVRARALDNAFLGWITLDDPLRYLAFRTAHLHDLFHYLLGYEAWDPIGEMEIEAFLLAQTGATNHLFFLTGFVMNLVTNGRVDELLRARARLAAAHALGRRAHNLMLVRWEEQLARPLADVKRELGIGERPESRPDLVPKATPKLAHVVLTVPDVAEARAFYEKVFGYHVIGEDAQLGAVFLTAGDDHHTVALTEALPRSPLGLVRKAPTLLARAGRLLEGRLSPKRSAEGRRKVLPPLAVAMTALRPGLQHLGFRVADAGDLETYVHLLRAHGHRVVWQVNHGDLIHGVYFFDAGGSLCELFVDTEAAKARTDEARAAFARGERLRADPDAMHSYDLERTF